MSLFGLSATVFCLTPEISFSRPLSVKWRYQTDLTTPFTPSFDGDLIFLPLSGGNLVTLQTRDGKLLWQTDVGGEFSASPNADSRRVYVASSESTTTDPKKTSPPPKGLITALGRQSGITSWRLSIPSPLRGSLAASEQTIFGAGDDGKLYAVEKDSGRILWATHLGGASVSHPVISDGRIYLGGTGGNLFAVDAKSGKALWRYRTRGALRGAAAVSPRAVYIGSADNFVYALDKKTGQALWRTRTGAEVQAIALSKNGLIVASLDNFIYLLSSERGDRVWKRRMPGRVAAPPLISEDSALFAPLAGDSCVALNLTDGKILNSIIVGEDNNTTAAPVASDALLFITTRQGLLAFANNAAESGG